MSVARFRATSGRVGLFNLTPAANSQHKVCHLLCWYVSALTDSPAKTCRTWPGLGQRWNVRERTQRSKGAVREWQAKGRFRRWPNSHRQADTEAGIRQCVRSLFYVTGQHLTAWGLQRRENLGSSQPRSYPTLDRPRSTHVISRETHHRQRAAPQRLRTQCTRWRQASGQCESTSALCSCH